ncbi:MAG: leucyl aminopeptidase family protein, partial [Deltaproteobacteria bacterium]|jgi:leucyl aminopeptidase|nr:leucyl aminopeptidase family protein [Deltaproteobacteria bacterium]MBW2533592.1 leucyl aminopeptidase family protein [Deltaproteobacteria bacterium]
VALLGGLGALWEPLEAREALGEADVEPVTEIGFVAPAGEAAARVARVVAALEEGRRLARDLAGTNPERMRPEAFAALCEQEFAGGPVRCEVVSDGDAIRRGYPLLAAVARASEAVERHRPRIVRLTYEGAEPTHTLLFAGKGVTYDSGGADLKVGGHMAGMSRDKGGAAAVAGLLQTIARLQPSGIRVVAELGLVRNSIGADAYVADEIIESHAGVRVRVGNTDAEGRMVLADLLSHLRLAAVNAKEPKIFTVATLTGHAARAVGPYSIAIDNGPAQQAGIAHRLARVGDGWGDPFSISRVRREDYDFVAPRSRADDVLQCNNDSSVNTARGHQFPMAFLAIAAGLVDHGLRSATPLPFTHVDIGGSACVGGDWQHGRPTAAPVVALAAAFVLDSVQG